MTVLFVGTFVETFAPWRSGNGGAGLRRRIVAPCALLVPLTLLVPAAEVCVAALPPPCVFRAAAARSGAARGGVSLSTPTAAHA